MGTLEGERILSPEEIFALRKLAALSYSCDDCKGIKIDHKPSNKKLTGASGRAMVRKEDKDKSENRNSY